MSSSDSDEESGNEYTSPEHNNGKEEKEGTPVEGVEGKSEVDVSHKNAEVIQPCYSLTNLPEEVRSMIKPLQCDLCKVKVESNITALTHYKGKPHKKKVLAYLTAHYKDQLEQTDGPAQKKMKLNHPSMCDICDVALSSEIVAKQHFCGKAHLRKVKQKKEEGENTTFINVPKANFDPSGRFGIGEAFVQQTEGEENSPSSLQIPNYCSLCKVTCPDNKALKDHLKGTKHLKRLKKEQEGTLGISIDLSMYRTPSNSYYCPKCDLNTNSKDQFVQHLDSKKHRTAKSKESEEMSDKLLP